MGRPLSSPLAPPSSSVSCRHPPRWGLRGFGSPALARTPAARQAGCTRRPGGGLVHLLHARALVDVLLQRGQVLLVVVQPDVLLDGQAELDHAMDAPAEGVGLLQREARGEQRRLEEQQHEVLHRLVRLVGVGTLAQLLHDDVVRVDLERLLRRHVPRHGRVPQRLRLHDALHVGGPPVLPRHQHARGVHHAVRNQHLLNLVAQDVLHQAAQPLVLRLDLLLLGLLLLSLVQLEALLGARQKLLAIVLLELLHRVLVDGVHHEQHLQSALLELLDERRVLNCLARLASDVIDLLLVLLHARDVVLERRHLLAALGRMIAQELGQLGAVLGIFVDAQLDVLAERLVKLGVVVLVLRHLVHHLQALLHDVLLDHLQDLVLLQHLARNVEGKVLGVHDALHEGQVLRNDVFAVVHDEHAAHVQLDVVGLFLSVEHVECCALGHEEHRLELELSLHRKVLHSQLLLPVVGERLVKGGVLVLGDLLGRTHPNGLLLVHDGPLVRHLLDLLGLLLLLLVLVLDLGDLSLLIRRGILLLVVIVVHLLLCRLLGPQRDGVADELGVLLH
mmetsp:Transcript_12723/g.20591  ORF Transcript_12723/g.20591 Transcript_12723/m.20591 type:complete len:561 (-) Transcript_12723:637-2319(-)